jgi:hypothetical protein
MRSGASAARVATALAAVGVVLGCAGAPPAPAPRPLPEERAAYLLDPSPLAPPEQAPAIAALYRRLLAGASPGDSARELASLGEPPGAGEANGLVLAQVAFAADDRAGAARRLADVSPRVAASAPARLLAARLAELDGRPVEAFELYAGLSAELPLAAARRDAVRAAAAARLVAAVEEAVAARRDDEAARELARLERVAPRAESTLELAARVAAARGDRRGELAAVRALAAAHPETIELSIRRGLLEIEVGDAGVGLELLRRLAEGRPDDAAAAAALARGRFLYRLANAPEPVRGAARRRELTRADFARLLYWLAPGVRTARPAALRIAADSLDHPAREEIVRVANLGLMRVDEALHAFEPDRALARADAFVAFARLRGSAAASRADGCRFALDAGWIASAPECLPGGPVAGEEAIEWLRQAAADEVEE